MAWIDGTAGNDDIAGTDNADRIYGQGGNDTLSGKRGGDTLYGNDGNDKLYGGKGGDTLYGGDGDDLLQGGEGKDTFVLTTEAGFDRITDFTPGEDVIVFNNLDGEIYIPSIEDPYSYLSDFSYSGTTLSYLGGPVADVAGFTLDGGNLLFV